MNNIEIYSFFSGVGLLDLGFENAGFKIAFVNEIDERFLYAYQYARKNKKKQPKYGYSHKDIREYLLKKTWEETFPDYDQRKKIIGFIGGPPCPDFSIAGKNVGEKGKNGKLTSIYINLIIKRKPDFFVFENVKGLYKTKRHRKFYESVKGRLKKNGYYLFDSIENSLSYGVPQYRDRLFLVGFSKAAFNEKTNCILGSHRKYELDKILKLPWPKTMPFSLDDEYKCPAKILKRLTIEYWFKKNDVLYHPNCNDTFKVKAIDKYQTINEGATAGKSFKRLHRWRYAPTSAYGNNEVHLHPYKLRRISVAEALAIQSAPKYFVLPKDITLSAKFKMVGNAVPVLLAQGIAKSVLDTINNYKKEINNG